MDNLDGLTDYKLSRLLDSTSEIYFIRLVKYFTNYFKYLLFFLLFLKSNTFQNSKEIFVIFRIVFLYHYSLVITYINLFIIQ
jgi:hypothetical protein